MKSDFIVAVHALVYLAHRGCLTSSEELADNICTNPARVRKIMGKLKKIGIITTREGHVGGYCPCEGLEKVTLYDIAKGMGTVFVDTKWRSGNEDLNCFISGGMAQVFDRLYKDLDELCMIHLKKITLGDVTNQIVSQQLEHPGHCRGAITGDCPAWENKIKESSKQRTVKSIPVR